MFEKFLDWLSAKKKPAPYSAKLGLESLERGRTRRPITGWG